MSGSSEKTTEQLGEEAGLSRATYARRNAVGKKMHEKTAEILDAIDAKTESFEGSYVASSGLLR